MYKLKKEIKFEGTQKKIAEEIGISEAYFSKILNRKKKCSKLVAYCITKRIDNDKEILDYFERVD